MSVISIYSENVRKEKKDLNGPTIPFPVISPTKHDIRSQKDMVMGALFLIVKG